MNCGHCGSAVNPGYTVCTGCGAKYRGSQGKVIFGAILVFLFAVPTLTSLFSIGRPHGIVLLVAAALPVVLGGLLLKSGLTKRWYRYNA
jgi:asparagine N-glycosylation enzyme membrane subunit Stt3